MDGSKKTDCFVLTFQKKTNYQKAYKLIQQNPYWDIEDKEIKIDQSDLDKNWLQNLKHNIQILT